MFKYINKKTCLRILSLLIFITALGYSVHLISNPAEKTDKKDRFIQKAEASENANIAFTDYSGTELTSVTLNNIASDEVYVNIELDTMNYDSTIAESYSVYVTSSLEETIQIQVSETGTNTGIFRSDSNIPLQTAISPIPGNDILEVERGGSIIVTFDHYSKRKISPAMPNTMNIQHAAKLSLSGDISSPTCDDTWISGEGFGGVYYSGNSADFDPNDSSGSPESYIPTTFSNNDYTDSWDAVEDSVSVKCLSPIEDACNTGGVYNWEYGLSDDEKHDAYGYSKEDSAYDASHALGIYFAEHDTAGSNYCAGWNVTYVDIPVETGMDELILNYSIGNTYNGSESINVNDTYILIYNPSTDEWETEDYIDNQDFTFDFETRQAGDSSFSNSYLTINSDVIENYSFETQFGEINDEVIRFAFAGFDLIQSGDEYSGGGEYAGESLVFDYVFADVTYRANGIDLINIEGGSSNLSGTVWNDENENEQFDTGETLLSGVIITLYDINDRPVAIDRTDASGNYSFENLISGSYRVIAGAIPDFTPPSDDNDSSVAAVLGESTSLGNLNVPFVETSNAPLADDGNNSNDTIDEEDTASSDDEPILVETGQRLIIVWIGAALLIAGSIIAFNSFKKKVKNKQNNEE